MSLLIKAGRIIDPSQNLDRVADLLVRAGRIDKIEPDINTRDAETIIDARGLIVAPGFIDLHCHLREPGYEWKETIASGTRAATRGGFTCVNAMPNTYPPVDRATTAMYILSRALDVSPIRVTVTGAVTRNMSGKELAPIGELAAAGVVALSDDGKPVSDAGVMRRAMEYALNFGLPIISHCEEMSLSRNGVVNEGYTSLMLGLPGIPAAAEEVMVARDIILARMTGARVHIAHVSTAGSVELVREAKRKGVPVTAEVTPHHLSLTEQDIIGYCTAYKVKPPLRTKKDIEALIEGLQDGTIDAIATDHAPHSQEEKDLEFMEAPFGISGLETAVPVLVTYLIAKGHISWSDLITKLATNPARILRLETGTLKPGSIADITIIDPEMERTVNVNEFASQGKNNPFNNHKLIGWPVYTIAKGNIVMNGTSLYYSER